MSADTLIQEPESMDGNIGKTFYVQGFPSIDHVIPVILKYLLMEDGSLSLVWDIGNWHFISEP